MWCRKADASKSKTTQIAATPYVGLTHELHRRMGLTIRSSERRKSHAHRARGQRPTCIVVDIERMMIPTDPCHGKHPFDAAD
jgi:hypothetical protein